MCERDWRTHTVPLNNFSVFFVLLSVSNLLFVPLHAQICQSSLDIISCGTGTCITVVQGFAACLCPSGYAPTGDSDNKCQVIDICTSPYTSGKICFNGGTCSVPPGAQPGKYSCSCPKEYSGDNCQHRVDVCGSADCQNGGTCVIDSSKPAGYYCYCPPNFTGDNCQVPSSIGVGGSGTPLTTVQLIICWALWLLMAITFLYCAVNMLIDWWCKRMRKAVTGAVAG